MTVAEAGIPAGADAGPAQQPCQNARLGYNDQIWLGARAPQTGGMGEGMMGNGMEKRMEMMEQMLEHQEAMQPGK